MSGAGRKSQYRKSVTDDFLYNLPIPAENEYIMEVISSRGSNVFEVKSPDGKIELALLPKKFHKLIWVKRGEYVIVLREVSEEDCNVDVKVRSVIQHVLNKDGVKNLEKLLIWPSEFITKSSGKATTYSADDLLPPGTASSGEESGEEERGDDDDLLPPGTASSGEESGEEERDDDDEDGIYKTDGVDNYTDNTVADLTDQDKNCVDHNIPNSSS